MVQIGSSNVITSGAQIVDGIVDTADLADGAVTNAKVGAAAAIAQSKIALSITNSEINAAAAIADTKLAQITTAGKVSGAALTSLASIPGGAGTIPAANLPSANTSHNSGRSGRNHNAVSGAQTIAHGLSGTPTKVRLQAFFWVGADHVFSMGSYDANGQHCISHSYISSSLVNSDDDTNAISLLDGATGSQKGVVSVDGTNITITWTKTGSPNFGNPITFYWEAML